ncbi:MAG: phosphoribosylamine--glycine ligase [Gemmatimonadota bacterium]
MKVLVVGGGGREHALVWALRRDHPAVRVFCCPGNAGTAELATNLPIPADAIDELVTAGEAHQIDLVVVGPENALALGLADRLRARGRLVFGPSQAAAQIEASKAFAKDVMAAAGVATAQSQTFTNLDRALQYVNAHPEPLVVKASGLAAGKGAVVCATRPEARQVLRSMLGEGSFGDAGRTVVVESFLEGEELSVLAITNGEDARILPSAQDHKRLLEGDRGPNTGGMGAYSPVALETPELLEKVRTRVLLPTLAELDRRGARFAGVLYAGLMIDPAGEPWVIEFNCRFGDPETQVILPRLTSGLTEALLASALGKPIPPFQVGSEAAVTTVLAARGYPDHPQKGAAITIPKNLPINTLVFHAGTERDEKGVLRSSGGRVLAVTGLGASFREAQLVSRSAAELINFEGKQYRRDVGWRESQRGM